MIIESGDHVVDERCNAQTFAKAYKGLKWDITSCTVYRYKDTGEHLYSICLRRKNWDGRGDEKVRLMIAKTADGFQARPAEMSRWD